VPDDAPTTAKTPGRVTTARRKLLVSLAAGVLVGIGAQTVGAGRAAPLIGWDVLAVLFCGWVWVSIWNMDGPATARHALRENPGRDASDLILLGAAAASLIAVVFVSWTLIHTVFTLKYARLYYTGTPGGIDFNESAPPQYSDFAYLAFTIGMTFQVSDTNLQNKDIRRTALRHAWLSFPLGAVIIAASINLISGLAK